MDTQTDRQTYREVSTNTDRYTEIQTDKQIDGQTYRQTETDRQRDREVPTNTDRDRQTDKKTDRQTYRERETVRHTRNVVITWEATTHQRRYVIHVPVSHHTYTDINTLFTSLLAYLIMTLLHNIKYYKNHYFAL